MPRRVTHPRYSNVTQACLDDDLKRVKLAIEREKLCHLRVKTAQLPPSLTERCARKSVSKNAQVKGGDTDVDVFQRSLHLSLSRPDYLESLFEYRREQGCNDSQFLTSELAVQCSAQLETLGL